MQAVNQEKQSILLPSCNANEPRQQGVLLDLSNGTRAVLFILGGNQELPDLTSGPFNGKEITLSAVNLAI